MATATAPQQGPARLRGHPAMRLRGRTAAVAWLRGVAADISAEVTAATRKEMAEWLGRNRLHLHAEVITAVAGL